LGQDHGTAMVFPRERQPFFQENDDIRKFVYKPTLKPFKNIFTDRPRVFIVESILFNILKARRKETTGKTKT
jgi:hypothetical protein